MTREYTRKESAAINQAWAIARAVAESLDYRAAYMLDQAEKIERRERGGRTVARALLLDMIAETLDGRWSDTAQLYSLCEGARIVAIVAAEWRRSPPDRAHYWGQLHTALPLAVAANDAARGRALAALAGQR